MSGGLVTPAAEIPAALRDRLFEALEAVGKESGAVDDVAPDVARLAAAALERLRLVLDSDGGRAAALDLLAADALLTDACAAAALSGAEGIEGFTRTLVARLAELIPA